MAILHTDSDPHIRSFLESQLMITLAGCFFFTKTISILDLCMWTLRSLVLALRQIDVH
jgi:hypothetical protein